MGLVNVTNVVALENPTWFTNPLSFEITFECLQNLDDDLEWKIVYVGSSDDSSRDQILADILVGPVPAGVNKFVLHANPPDPSQIPEDDLIGMTVLLIVCSYRRIEFVRIGYYVRNEYAADEETVDRPFDYGSIFRTILAEKPRVTRYSGNWCVEDAMDDSTSSS